MDSVLGVILTTVLGIAIVMDLRSSRIPNWLTFPAMGFALAGHAWLNGIDGVLFSLAGFGVGLGLFFFIYLAGGLGAGDVRLAQLRHARTPAELRSAIEARRLDRRDERL